jgi:hypothetical protein
MLGSSGFLSGQRRDDKYLITFHVMCDNYRKIKFTVIENRRVILRLNWSWIL